MTSYKLWSSVLGFVFVLFGCNGGESDIFGFGKNDGLVVDRDKRIVILDGRIYPSRYNHDPNRAYGHHAVTWQGGSRARQALVETLASDYEVSNALRSLGTHAGRPLPQEVWSERNNPNSPYPDWRAEGDRIQVELIWEGVEDWIPLAKVLVDRSQLGIDIRFEGQEELIPVWQSGCIVCLASCPGAKASNSRYTIRDQLSDTMDFQSCVDLLPPDGTSIRVRLSVMLEK